MFENLSERLESAFKQIKGEGRITELNIAATVKDIRRALIDADVNFKIAKEFTDTVREKALGSKVLTAVRTLLPNAFSRTVSVNSLAILKLTSASISARRISLTVAAMFSSVIRPSPFICLNADSSRSDKFSNMVVLFMARGQSNKNKKSEHNQGYIHSKTSKLRKICLLVVYY